MPELIQYRLDALEKEVIEQKKHIELLQEKVAEREMSRVLEERRRLLWGIGALGTVVMTLVGIILAPFRSFLGG